MGCDIHAHLEVKIENVWRYYAPVKLWRNYEVFSKMAGVRSCKGSPNPISLPKGLPKDVTFMTKFHSDYLDEDGHSHSWFNYDEILELLEFFNNKLGYKPWGDYKEKENRKWNDLGIWIFGNSISGFRKYPADYPETLQDIRLIFWFDN